MSESMSGGDTDALAAEYVLGTLDADERAQAQSLLSADEAFSAKVKVWERRFGELHLMVEPVEPDGQIWERIKGKMPAATPDPEIKHPEPAAGEPAADQAAATVASTEIPAPSSELPAAAAPEATPGSSPAATGVPGPGVATARGPAVAANPASAAATAAPGVTQIPPAREAAAVLERRLGRWRAFAGLMTVLVAAMAALLGLWKFAPEHVPTALAPVELMRRMGVELTPLPSAQPPRRGAAPASQFDE